MPGLRCTKLQSERAVRLGAGNNRMRMRVATRSSQCRKSLMVMARAKATEDVAGKNISRRALFGGAMFVTLSAATALEVR